MTIVNNDPKEPKTPFEFLMEDLLGFASGSYGWSGVEPGWFDLVRTLVRALDAEGWDRELHQVKEKFGGLRFYAGSLTERMQQLINEAEDVSFTICEQCSAHGTPGHRGGWITTLCEPCRLSLP